MTDPAPRPTPFVLWFTGLSGSGKSTLAEAVEERLRDRGLPVERLDGDTVRDVIGRIGFSREERDRHVRYMGFLASRLEAHGINVIASFISPHEEAREFIRERCGRFVLVHLTTSLETCEGRDVKGLYARARRGELTAFTGIDDPFEEPRQAEIRLDTGVESIESATATILESLALG